MIMSILTFREEGLKEVGTVDVERECPRIESGHVDSGNDLDRWTRGLSERTAVMCASRIGPAYDYYQCGRTS